MRVVRFPSVESYAAEAERLFPSHNNSSSRYSSYDRYEKYGGGSEGFDWDGGVGFRQAIEFSKRGDPKLVGISSKTVDKLIQEFVIKEEQRSPYRPSIAGSRVDVPAFLAGSPMSMRRRQTNDLQVRNVNIYVSTTCAGAISAESMLKRGATILALLEFLQMSQVSVELYLLAETNGKTDGDFVQVIQVESRPLNLSTASFAIAHPAFARQMTYAVAYKMDSFNGNWGRMRGASGTSKAYQNLLADNIGLKPDDIYVPAASYYDSDITIHPEKWLENQIIKIKGENYNAER